MKDDNNMMNNDYDEEERQLVLDFENTILKGGNQFFDEDEMEVIIDYYFEVNDLEPLQRAVEYAEELYPDSTTVRLRRAHLMIAHEQFDSALHIIKQLRRKEPDNTDVAYSLGVAYGAVGEHRKAIELYRIPDYLDEIIYDAEAVKAGKPLSKSLILVSWDGMIPVEDFCRDTEK